MFPGHDSGATLRGGVRCWLSYSSQRVVKKSVGPVVTTAASEKTRHEECIEPSRTYLRGAAPFSFSQLTFPRKGLKLLARQGCEGKTGLWTHRGRLDAPLWIPVVFYYSSRDATNDFLSPIESVLRWFLSRSSITITELFTRTKRHGSRVVTRPNIINF